MDPIQLAYIKGFTKKCAEAGVNPDALAKWAQDAVAPLPRKPVQPTGIMQKAKMFLTPGMGKTEQTNPHTLMQKARGQGGAGGLYQTLQEQQGLAQG